MYYDVILTQIQLTNAI